MEITKRRAIIKKVSLDNMGQARSERDTFAQLVVDHDQHIIALRKTSGPNPDIAAVLSLLSQDRDCRRELEWAQNYNRFERNDWAWCEIKEFCRCKIYKVYTRHFF